MADTGKSENFLSPTTIKLYGVPFDGLAITPMAKSASAKGHTNDLKDLLASDDLSIARIYAFTYEGVFYLMPKPTAFVVVGKGSTATGADMIAAKDWELSPSMKMWEMDRRDDSIRLDIETGTMEEILLEAALFSGNLMASRAELVSRAELASRAEMASRAELSSRAELASRAELVTRRRFKS